MLLNLDLKRWTKSKWKSIEGCVRKKAGKGRLVEAYRMEEKAALAERFSFRGGGNFRSFVPALHDGRDETVG
ncbi:MAG: hypothetical protein M1510_08455 [Nitrospirae bacterium]|nr:hypothetical protein [Nitrospirota bacterium]MCL5236587.1 hypothetical protein [Nitrospirota bacterium]